MTRWSALAVTMVLVVTACTLEPSSPETSSIAVSATTDPTRQPSLSFGSAQVTVDGTVYAFALNRCEVGVEALVAEGFDGTRSLTIRHASPPTRRPAEPAMSVLVIENGERLEAPPASLVLAAYDPTAGSAEGEAPVASGGDGELRTATFTIQCERL